MENANIATQNMVDPKYRYSQKRIARVSGSFARAPGVKSQAELVSNTIDEARLYRLCYIQDGQEMRADYFEYVYDTSFARRRRRNRY
jgi:hypothetical protein